MGRAQTSLEQFRRSFEDVRADVRDQVERHPWRSLAMALGAGYVVGGGLFTALTGRLLWGGIRVGLRVAALPIVRDEVYSLIDALSERRQTGETERRTQ